MMSRDDVDVMWRDYDPSDQIQHLLSSELMNTALYWYCEVLTHVNMCLVEAGLPQTWNWIIITRVFLQKELMDSYHTTTMILIVLNVSDISWIRF